MNQWSARQRKQVQTNYGIPYNYNYNKEKSFRKVFGLCDKALWHYGIQYMQLVSYYTSNLVTAWGSRLWNSIESGERPLIDTVPSSYNLQQNHTWHGVNVPKSPEMKEKTGYTTITRGNGSQFNKISTIFISLLLVIALNT